MNNTSETPRSGVAYHAAPIPLVQVTGADRVSLLHRLSTQDLKPLAQPGLAADTLFATAQGKVMAWTRAHAGPEALWLTCQGETGAQLAAWIARYTIMEDADAVDVQPGWVQVQLFGCEAAHCVGLDGPVAAGRWQHAPWQHSAASPQTTASGAGIAVPHLATALLPAWGPGLSLLVPQAVLPALETHLQGQGAQPLTTAQWQVRRMMAGVPWAAAELAGGPNPFEARLAASTIHWHKGCYIGQEVISRLDSYNKVARLLVGLEASGPLPTASDDHLKIFCDGRPVGRITSWAATADGAVGLAVVKRAIAQQTLPLAAQAGVSIEADCVAVRLVDRPFWLA